MTTRRINLPVWLLAGLAIASAACDREAPTGGVQPRPVRTQVVATHEASIPSVQAGVARAGIESNLSFRVSGTVVGLPATVGRRVRPGQVLCRLDPVDYELAVEEAKASLAQAQAGLRRSIADYGRVRALYENNNAAKSELDAARADFESAEAQVDAGQKRLEQAEQQLDYTVMRAPVAGDVAAVDIEINETVSAGQTVVRLTSGETPEVEVAVSEITIPYIRSGMPAVVRFDALPDRTFDAVVTEVGVATAQGASTYPVTLRLEGAGGQVRSGMAAEATFEIGTGDGERRIVLPSVAVGEDDGGAFVFLVESSGEGLGVVRRRAVRVGEFTLDGIEVLDGLSVGEVVVTAGVRRMVDGTTVRYEPQGTEPWM